MALIQNIQIMNLKWYQFVTLIFFFHILPENSQAKFKVTPVIASCYFSCDFSGIQFPVLAVAIMTDDFSS